MWLLYLVSLLCIYKYFQQSLKLNIQDKITVLYTNWGGMEISKCWIIGGWKKLIINGWVRHNGRVDLKMERGGWVILSKVILVSQKTVKKTSTFSPNAPKILSKCIPELPKRYIFFYISMLVVSVTIAETEKKFYVVYLYFEFQIV